MTTFGAGRGDKNGSDAFESYFASVATFSGSRRLLADAASVKSDYEVRFLPYFGWVRGFSPEMLRTEKILLVPLFVNCH